MNSKLELLKQIKPNPLNVSSPLVEQAVMGSKGYPMVYTPASAAVNLLEWVSMNLKTVEEHLHRHGAVLFRGFNMDNVEGFQAFLKTLGHVPLKYTNRSSPRTEIQNNIYTSTEHPSDQYINMHNELSYASQWPLKIAFFCLKKATSGGETPIADSRRVLAKLKEATKRKFIEKHILYVRNLGFGLGMGWREVFQVDTRKEVEEICARESINVKWLEGDQLTINFLRPAIRQHPATGEEVWFNHAYFFNILSLSPSLRNALQHSPESLPFYTTYGDQSPIEKDVIEEITAAYESEKVQFRWEEGDILLLDNMLTAHGRNPFQGDRKIVAGMLELYASNHGANE